MLYRDDDDIQPFATRFPCDGVSGGGGRNDARASRGMRQLKCAPTLRASAVRQRDDSARHPVPNGRECQRHDRAYSGSGYETPGRPAVLLLHGFPELAYSWRKVMLPLASAGYHVIAPDQRGYGRTTAGMIPTTPIPIRFACSTWCEMRLGLSTRLATARSRWWSDTMPVRRSRPGPRSSGPISSVRSPS